jgi:acylphosphatase
MGDRDFELHQSVLTLESPSGLALAVRDVRPLSNSGHRRPNNAFKQPEQKDFVMRAYTYLRRTFGIAAAMTYLLLAVVPIYAKSNVEGQNTVAVSGKVTGKVQQVGFRALIQKQAIQYNLAGSAENNSDGSVGFILQGDNDRIRRAVKTITAGTKKSSNVNVSTSPATTDQNLNTFTVVGWTSLSRGINNSYDLVFHLRNPDAIIEKGQVKAVRLQICESAVKDEDSGKCDKGNDD